MTAVTGRVGTAWQQVPAWWRRAIVGTAALWLVSMLVVVVAAGTLPLRETVDVTPTAGFGGWTAPEPDASGAELVGSGLVRFDALWYLAIAADGYPTTPEVHQAAAFFPGYPAVVAGLGGLLGGRLVLAAQLVALAGCAAALAGLQRLAALLRPDGGDELARRTVLVTVAFPTAFFLVAPYAESLFLACAAWALVHAARGRPWLAAALTAAATLARPVGVLLVVPLLLGVVRRDDPPSWTHRIVPGVGAAAALAGIALFGLLRWDDPLAVVHAQSAWQRGLTGPWTSVQWAVEFALRDLGAGSTGYQLLDLLVFSATLTGIGVLARARQWPLAAHGAVNVLLWLTQPFPSRPLLSTPRFAVVVPGVLLGLVLATRARTAERVWLPVSAGLFAIHLALFSRWWYVF